MRVVIDGKEYEGKDVQILEDDDVIKKVHVKKFRKGIEGECFDLETLLLQVFESSGEVPSVRGCADWPILPKTYQWVWYRGMRWGLRNERGRLMFFVPGDDVFLPFIEENKEKIEQARNVYGSWAGN